MRLLIDCTPLAFVSGGLQVASALMENLARGGVVDWKAVVPSHLKGGLPAELAARSNVVFVNKTSAFDVIKLSRALAEAENKFKPNIVFTVFGPAYFKAKAPHVVGFALPNMIYSSDCAQTVRPLTAVALDPVRAILFRRATHLVVETETVRKRVVEKLGIDRDRITVIGNCVNPVLAQIEPAPTLSQTTFGILVPSAYYRHKNLEIIPAVAAALRAIDATLPFEFRLTLAPDSPQWMAIARQAEQLGVSRHIKTLGAVPLAKLGTEYLDASIVFLPTLREASTAVYPEAFHFCRPLVTSDIDFARELCGDAALFAEPSNAAAWASALHQVLSVPSLGARLIAAGKDQLGKTYPTPDLKFTQQMAMLRMIAEKCQDGKPRNPMASNERPYGSIAQQQSKAAIAFHDDIATDWDAKYKSGGFRRRDVFFRTVILPLMENRGKWLDTGCGSGFFSRILATQGFAVIGIDASIKMIEAAKEQASRVGLSQPPDFQVVEDLVPLQFGSASFSGCLCLSVIEYLADAKAFLNEIARVLEPGGVLVISVPNRRSVVRRLQAVLSQPLLGDHGLWRYRSLSTFSATEKEFASLLNECGFKLVTTHNFDPIMPGALSSVMPGSLMFVIAQKTSA